MKMVRRRQRRRPRRRRVYARIRRRMPKKISIIQTASAIAIPFLPAHEGWGSPIDDVKNGDVPGVLNQIIHGFQPLFYADLKTGEMRFDLHVPRYLALLVLGNWTSKIAGMFGANKMFKGLPGPLKKLKW